MEFKVNVSGRQLAGFAAGTGPDIVLLVHGWGGSAVQMAHLIEPLTTAGLRVVGVDLPAHGKSPGRQTNPFELAAAVAAIAGHFGGVYAVVAHSMGAFATALAMSDGLEVQRVAFVAPLVRVEAAFERFQQISDLPAEASNALRRHLENRFGEDMFHDLSLDQMTWDPDTPALIFHAAEDAEVPFGDSEALAAVWESASLVDVVGLGHHRILRTHTVVDRIVQFVNADRLGQVPISQMTSHRPTPEERENKC